MTEQILFEKFNPVSCIKKDAYSAVYLAEHIFLKKTIFLKYLNTELVPDRAILQRFKREAKTLAQLEHPNIIKIYDFGTFDKYFYISFEYFKSENLRTLLSNNKLEDNLKETIFKQLCLALEYAHQNNIIHRDLKPENILVEAHGNLKIADFGLAIFNDETGITEASSLVGTPAYMAPEQINGQKSNSKSDLFALGIILYELYSGKNPFLGNDAGQTINNIIKFKDDLFEDTIASFPDEIQTILNGLLRKSPAQRFDSLQPLIDSFANSEETKIISYPAPKKSSLPKYLFAAIILILAGLWILFTLQKKETSPALVETDSSSVVQEKMNIDSVTIQKQETIPVDKPVTKQEEILQTKEANKSDKLTEQSQKKQSAQPALGKLEIECLPWAKIQIDSGKVETTPLANAIELSAGAHQLQVENPAYPFYQTTVIIDSAQTTVFKINLDTLMGYLDCKINPWGDVYLNGQAMGQSPFSDPFKLRPGNHKLLVQNDYYRTYEQDLDIKKNDTLFLKINLTGK